jgi:hypothetical protein
VRIRIAAGLALAIAWTSAAAEPPDPTKALEAARRALSSLQSQLDELGRSIAERDKLKDAAAASSGAQIAELRSEIAAIRQAMAEQKRAVDESGADAQRLEAENKSLKAKLDQATKASADAAKVGTDAAKARDEIATLSQALEARAKEVERLKSELAETRKEVAAFEQKAASVVVAKSVEAPASGSAQAKIETVPVSAAPARPVPPEPDLSAAKGGIKQWKQPDGTLFFGETPRVPGSKLVAVIGAEAPAAASQ